MGAKKNVEEYNRHIIKNVIIDFTPDPKYNKYLNTTHGELTIKKYIGKDKNYQRFFLCECSCGVKKICCLYSILHGTCTSCGHVQRAKVSSVVTKHKLYHSRLYNIYHFMISSYHKKHYKNIKICDEWEDKENGFMNFYNWAMNNGYGPGLIFTRINVNEEYSPNNCKWTPMKYLTYQEYTFPLTVWVEITKLSYNTLSARIRKKWTPEEILRTPQNRRRGNGYLDWTIDPKYIKED